VGLVVAGLVVLPVVLSMMAPMVALMVAPMMALMGGGVDSLGIFCPCRLQPLSAGSVVRLCYCLYYSLPCCNSLL